MYKVGRPCLLIIYLHRFLLGHNFTHTNVSLPPGTPTRVASNTRRHALIKRAVVGTAREGGRVAGSRAVLT